MLEKLRPAVGAADHGSLGAQGAAQGPQYDGPEGGLAAAA